MNRQSAEGIIMSEDAMSSRHRRRRLARAVTAMFVFVIGTLGEGVSKFGGETPT